MRHATRPFLICGVLIGAVTALLAQDVKELTALKGHQGVVTHLVFSPGGKILAAGTEKDGKRMTKLWDVATFRGLAAVDGNSPVFSPDGKWVATKPDEKSLILWESPSGKEVRRFADAEDGVFAPGGGSLAIIGANKKVKLIDTATWKEVRSVDYSRLTFSRGGKAVAAHTTGGDIVILDAATYKPITTLKGHTDSPMVEFSPNGMILASSEFGPADVILWDVATGEKRRTVSVPARYTVSRLAFTPDGLVLAAATMHTDFNVIGARCHVRLWEAATGKELTTLGGHTGGVLAMAFSADGKLLATTAADDVIRLWDAKTGKEVGTVKGHKVRRIGIHSLAFSPAGNVLASGSDDETVRLWDVKGLGQPKPGK